jgi:hypothetical protein
MPPVRRELAWIAVPLAAYFLILQRLWFNAPIWDDYDALLWWPIKMMDAKSVWDWLTIVVQQHNEHRIAVVRIAAWAMAMAGHIDFRVLTLLGNLTLVGFFCLAWLEFRHDVAAPVFCAAALLMFQWSYFEASLMASAALPNIGVVMFSLASLFFALRGRAGGAAACIALSILAVGSQASGLLALPVAAAGAFLAGRRSRALAFALAAAALWGAYFVNYYKPGGHPSMVAAFLHPIDAAHLFLVVVGGMSSWASAVPGAALLASIAWLARRRLWREHPTAMLWIAYLLLAAAAITVGRAGFGVIYASRYAIYSTSLAVVVLLSICATTRLANRAMIAALIAWCFAASLVASWMAWPAIRGYVGSANTLTRVVTVEGETGWPLFLGVRYPVYAHARHQLMDAENRRIYEPPHKILVHSTSVRVDPSARLAPQLGGNVDEVRAEGTRVLLKGWSDIPPQQEGRVLTVHGSPATAKTRLSIIQRDDVVAALGAPTLMLSGFELELDYGSPEEARRAAETLCLTAEAPGIPARTLARPGCTPG